MCVGQAAWQRVSGALEAVRCRVAARASGTYATHLCHRRRLLLRLLRSVCRRNCRCFRGLLGGRNLRRLAAPSRICLRSRLRGRLRGCLSCFRGLAQRSCDARRARRMRAARALERGLRLAQLLHQPRPRPPGPPLAPPTTEAPESARPARVAGTPARSLAPPAARKSPRPRRAAPTPQPRRRGGSANTRTRGALPGEKCASRCMKGDDTSALRTSIYFDFVSSSVWAHTDHKQRKVTCPSQSTTFFHRTMPPPRS